uniref:folate gamma-glutamyl hydrolase n=1 Tax=Geotrypetes seraphini TaxID=260995 RepID=A0A6P8PP17_GEOSA|nr:gamma-glutamyl hydrolase isoform X1 [Geotrypetes seraphini]
MALQVALVAGLMSVAAGLNPRPIVGILAQEIHIKEFLSIGKSYIAASYVKTLESAGARVVPIRLNLTDEEYEHIFYSINGILLPGGGVDLRTSQYANVARIFYRLALQANDAGDYFPVWGTCLGFEQLTVLTSDQLLLTMTDTENITLPLNFTTSPEKSKIFRNFPKDLLHSLELEPMTSNFHSWSLSVQNFTKNEKLRKFYKVVTTNTAGHLEFISTIEAFEYPIYGIQWHPEKNSFEWRNNSSIPHSPQAVKLAFYMAEFFVNEARKSFHNFKSSKEKMEALIYNYNPVFTGPFATFEQVYFFD